MVNTAAEPSKMDIVERVSYISSATPHKDGEYNAVKTPDIEGGALRGGGAPNLWSRECFGLLSQYCAIGLVYGTLPGTVYPFLAAYLNMEGTQTASARVLLTMPWSFKFIFGIITDCFPIFGYRRRPYMLLGWVLCLVCLISMACMDPGKPFWEEPEYSEKYGGLSDEILTIMNNNGTEKGVIANLSARDEGGKFIILMMLAAFGYIQAAVASDAVVCEFAQREPEAVRGTTQTAIYTARTIFVIVSQVLSGFFFNGKDYGGDYSFTLSFPQLVLILAIGVVPVIPITWFFVPEERVPGVNFKQYMVDFWELLKTQAMYQVVAYKFFSNVFDGFIWVASDPVARYWIGVTNLNDKLSGIIGNGVFAATLWMTGKYGLHWNWRTMSAVTMISMVALDSVVTMMGVWDVIRSQWFWLGVPIVGTVPSGVNFIIGTYVVVELAGMGNEGVVYGLVTTVNNLASPFASTMAKNVNSLFDVTNKDIGLDTTHVRWHVTYTIWFSYIMMILSLGWLVLLPPQKAETQELRRSGKRSTKMAAFTVFYVIFALCWSVMTNVLSIFPKTKCLRIAGGRGCKK